MRSYAPETLFDRAGRLVPELAALAPAGDRRMGANPHANGGRLLVRSTSPTSATTRSPCPQPARRAARVDAPARADAARHVRAQRAAQANFRLFCPDETNSNRLGAVFEVENRCFVGSDASTSTITWRRTGG